MESQKKIRKGKLILVLDLLRFSAYFQMVQTVRINVIIYMFYDFDRPIPENFVGAIY